ncbi:MAG: hypothetical protein IJ634_06025 [Bacteroidales bacterium]|nr:hypothetical protein [Bacteroidales bacterium]
MFACKLLFPTHSVGLPYTLLSQRQAAASSLNLGEQLDTAGCGKNHLRSSPKLGEVDARQGGRWSVCAGRTEECAEKPT